MQGGAFTNEVSSNRKTSASGSRRVITDDGRVASNAAASAASIFGNMATSDNTRVTSDAAVSAANIFSNMAAASRGSGDQRSVMARKNWKLLQQKVQLQKLIERLTSMKPSQI